MARSEVLTVFALLFLPLLVSTASLTLHISPTAALPNPQALPAQTHMTLSSATIPAPLSAPFTRNSSFFFPNIPYGSYLAEIWASTHSFVPMRVDVGPILEEVDGKTVEKILRDRRGFELESGKIKVWQTFRGHEWGSVGELLGEGEGKVDVVGQVLGEQEIFEKRPGFNLLGILKNPMMLIGIFGVGIMYAMPKMMESMDPEMRAEFEAAQKNGGLTGMLTGNSDAGNFDAAAFLSAQQPKSSGTEDRGGKTRRRG